MIEKRFNATVQIKATGSANAIYSALKPDVKSSPERQVSATIGLKDDELPAEMSDDALQLDILSPQSKLVSKWFLKMQGEIALS